MIKAVGNTEGRSKEKETLRRRSLRYISFSMRNSLFVHKSIYEEDVVLRANMVCSRSSRILCIVDTLFYRLCSDLFYIITVDKK